MGFGKKLKKLLAEKDELSKKIDIMRSNEIALEAWIIDIWTSELNIHVGDVIDRGDGTPIRMIESFFIKNSLITGKPELAAYCWDLTIDGYKILDLSVPMTVETICMEAAPEKWKEQ